MAVVRWVVLLIITGTLGSPAMAQTSADWPTFGGAAGGGQYSAIDQIKGSNVDRLEVAWTYRSGDMAWHEVTPIHANNTLYYCTPMNRVIALDPVTGVERWRFDPHKDEGGEGLIEQPRQVVRCRSVAYWEATEPQPGVPCERRVFKADINGNVYAIDADTGKSCKDFGAAKGHPGYASHWDYEGNGIGPRHTTSGPLVIDDLVVAAVGVEDSPVDASDGFVRAFDVRTGELRWEFNPIPPEHVHDTGAANVWSGLSADLERGLVFLPTTSPSSDFYGATRKFDIPFATATVALSAKTGEPVWHYQIVHHDLYDYDLPGHPLLVSISKDGQTREVAIQQTKQGFVFVFDRDDGAPVFPIEERPVPKSDIAGEETSATQPFPVLPEPFTRTTLNRDDLFGMTFMGRSWCRDRFDELRYEGMFTPPSEQGTLHFPGFGGGGNWGGAAFDPESNLLIIKSMTVGTQHWLIPNPGGAITPMPDEDSAAVPGSVYRSGDGDPLPGTPYSSLTRVFEAPTGVPCTPPPWGTLTAIDMDSGKIRWQRPFGRTKRYGMTFPESWGSAIIGGPIVTGGGLIFMAASMDKKFRALDVNSGKELWQAELPYAGMAVPMTYMAAGKQYVVIAAGGNRRTFTEEGDAIVAFALKEKGH
ncbi:MAG: pyrroloquinoline quinone-dependent dehydrogenase [Woeseiaceae bacterium]|nr:pyrroloquinoline quinone-dependent dehydrogenase [Woeseiaceae bacterium]